MPSDASRFPHRLFPALLLGLGLLAAALAGCGGGKKMSGTGASGELPDSEVEDFTVTETDSGRTQWTMFAKRAATYTARDLVTARTVRIDFFGDDGKKNSELVALEGELYQRTRDMVARGKVVLQTVEGWTMSTEELHFSNSRDRLLSDKLVRVEKEGSVLEGVGFESDPHLEHFEFRTQVRATVQPGAARAVSPTPAPAKAGSR
jgi:LPS export ABC transporter protein LptC